MQLDTLQSYERQYSAMLLERSSFDSHWRELGDHFLPIRAKFTTSERNRGSRRSTVLVDSSPRFSVRTLQSGLHAGLTSPARPWMKLTTPDPALAEVSAVKKWLHQTTQRMLTVFLRSNLYTALPTLYGDVGIFAIGAMSVLEDREDVIRCYNYPVGSYAVDTDYRGLVNTFCREWEMTVGQLIDTFDADWSKRPERTPDWSKFSESVRVSWEKKAYQDTVVVCWYVGPNREANPNRLGSKFLPVISVYWERGKSGQDRRTGGDTTGDAKVLKEGGYNEFPILVPRWDVAGEDTYGTDSPGMTTLGDVKALQVMQRKKAKAVEKVIDPALVGPTELRSQKTSLLAGDVTYLNVREGQLGLRAIHEVNLNIDHIRQDIRESQYRISRGFFEDLFLMLASTDGVRGVQPVTAREIEERHEEKLLALGPVLERFADELHDPLVDRVFAIMQRNGLIAPAPRELENVELKVEYLSIMAQAQKSVSLVGQDRFLQSVMGMAAQGFPDVLDKVDALQVVDDYAEMLGVNPNQVLSDDEAQAKAEQRAQAQQQAQLAESAPKIGAGVKSMADAKVGDTSALEAVLSGANAAAAGG